MLDKSICPILNKRLWTTTKTKPPPSFLERGIGGSNEDRTRYLIVANDALSQMSYGPVFWLAVNIISLFL